MCVANQAAGKDITGYWPKFSSFKIFSPVQNVQSFLRMYLFQDLKSSLRFRLFSVKSVLVGEIYRVHCG